MDTLKTFVAASMTAFVVMTAMPAAAQTNMTAAQIAAMIAQLQAQLQALQGGGTPATSCNFTQNLTVGSRGTQVTALQQLLVNGGYLSVSPTGYFGAMTKAALGKYQAANNISPASGYFGPLTRAQVNASCTGATGTPGTTPGGVVVPPATGLQVSRAADNPTVGSLIAGAGRVPVFAINLTAGNSGPATVNQIMFHKVGVISDSNINGAYLVQGGKVVAQYNSLSNGVITFSNLNLQIPAGQTQEYWLAVDVSTGVTAGNTVGFSINTASDINSVDASNNAITETGNFPVAGTTFTASTVSNPSLATLTITSSSVGTTVYAGTQNVLVSAWTVNGANNPVWLKSIKFKVIGSANKSDLQNVKLFINGTQVGSTLSSVAADGSAYFDLTSSPVSLRTGNSNMQVYADVMGSPSFNFQFEILNTYDVYAADSQYNTSLTPTVNGGAGIQVTIQQGQTTLSLSSDSPTGNIAKGQSNVTLGKFKIYAAGEAVKIKFLDINFTFTGATTSAISTTLKNIQLVDDAGNQVGSSISTPPSSLTCTGTGVAAGYTTTGPTTNVYSDCFGNSSSPINYQIPANTTRVLSLKADIQTGATFTTIQAAIGSDSGKQNLQGLTSSQVGDTGGGASASALSLAASSLTSAINGAVGTQTVTKSASGVKIGSYALSASSAEGVTISNISITIPNATAAANFQNLRVMVGSTQFGTTQSGTLASGGVYTFSGNPFTVALGSTQIVDVYSDVLSGATGSAQGTTLSNCTGTGATSFTSVSCTSVNGQTVTIGGAPAITVGLDSGASAPVGQIVAGTSQAPQGTFRFTETSGNEDVKITDITVYQSLTTTTTKGAVSNLTFYQGSTPVGVAGAANIGVATSSDTNVGPGNFYKFHFTTPVIVPKSSSVSLTLKGDVPAWNVGGGNFTDAATSTFRIATSSDTGNTTTSSIITALGNGSQTAATITLTGGTVSANVQTLLRSNLTVAAAPLGSLASRAKNTIDDVGTLTFSASNGGSVSLNQVKLTITGTLPTSTFISNNLAADDIKLYDPSTGAVVSPLASVSQTACSSGGTCTFTFNLASGTASSTGYVISAGTSKTFNVRVNSATHTTVAGQGVSDTLNVQVLNTGDVSYADATDGTGVATNLPATAVPVSVTSVSYTSGT